MVKSHVLFVRGHPPGAVAVAVAVVVIILLFGFDPVALVDGAI